MTGRAGPEYSPLAMMKTRRHTAWWALVVAGAILALTAMAGPDLVQHLGGPAKSHHDCAVYHWTHGLGAGASACASVAAPLPVVGPATLDVSPAPPSLSSHPTSSRAPPAIA